MSANTSLSLVSLDFDTLKASLKTYLKNQNQFADYDFDGSNMSVLLDILSYNSYKNAFYLNMVASEQFLDTAQLRNSVISLAKSLNYTPSSRVSSRAVLSISFPQSGLSTFSIPSGTQFTGVNANNSYTFVTKDSLTLYPSGNVFSIPDLFVYEGTNVQDTFVYQTNVENKRFVLSNDSIDIDSLSVTVIEDNSSNTRFQRAQNLFGVTETSNVYFLQATDNNKYELVFGDGIFGRLPKDYSTLVCKYRITNGTLGNGAGVFTLNDNLGPVNGYGSAIPATVTTITKSYGGAEAEGIESIRFKAPRHYQTQSRAVTPDDYRTIIKEKFQDIKDVNVYGGETVKSAANFGKVFVAPITFTGQLLPLYMKQEIESFLSSRCTIGIQPKVIDADYLYVVVKSLVKFVKSETSKSSNDIKSIVEEAIQSFTETSLTTFNTEFRHSRFETAINNADISISSNQTDVLMKKLIPITLNVPLVLSFDYRNEITPGSIYSTRFISNGRLYQYTDFNPNNNTFSLSQSQSGIVTTNASTKLYLLDLASSGYTDAGTIDYKLGLVNLSSVIISDLVGNQGLQMYCKPVADNITASGNDVIFIDSSTDVDITVQAI